MRCSRPKPRLFAAALIVVAHGAIARDAGQSFTDDDLARLLARDERGAIYVWSPHMPYSLTGAVEAKRLFDGLGLTTVLLLDPRADPALAGRARQVHRLPGEALRRMRADRLWRMGATEHFPTLIVFAGGQLDAQILPGYTPPGELAVYVRYRLQKFSPAWGFGE